MKKQDPQRDDGDQKQFHAPKSDGAGQPEEKEVARASILDDADQNDERRNE